MYHWEGLHLPIYIVKQVAGSSALKVDRGVF